MGLVDDLHDRRFKQYSKIMGHKTMDKTMEDLINLHRQGLNIALHVSEVINEDHTEYIKALRTLGEDRSVIR